jgi:hypothetical protein
MKILGMKYSQIGNVYGLRTWLEQGLVQLLALMNVFGKHLFLPPGNRGFLLFLCLE